MMQPTGGTRAQSGFTLMEMLIAVTITAIIGLGVWQVVSSVVNSRDRVNALAEEFDGLQKAMLLLERDITQVVNRSARDVYGDFKPSLTSRDDAFELLLTRQGWRNPLGLRRSGLQRAGWEYTGTELRRRYWPVIDQGQDEDSRDILLLEDVKTLEIRFLDEDGKWHDNWPTDQALAAMTPGQRPVITLPAGLEVTLEHERFGDITRLFTLPDFSRDQAQAVVNQQEETEPDGAAEDSGENATGGGA
ncbi:type II secretion system minor pseudopilin GspJ [Marinobacter litoralis]|uniref:type II secretion system minor pseudopilin GspJ n=1 Tax=Marinobacter litoralis TaxID=187981 RepID=UPI0018EDFD1D|nr:type II secretion system minor pseudopilin GspJ [Marinobacter litoralis]MBJ6138953.1 type II secretion system minor pseudopilin GspJ [Marinobacter litoralis]